MWRIKRISHIHIILIYFTFIYSQNPLFYSSCRYTRVLATSTRTSKTNNSYASSSSTATTTTITSNLPETETEPNDDGLSQVDIKNKKEQFKEIAKELVFNLKGEPTQPVPEKAFVPRAMLEEYIKMRESVREVIPDDRDFYGKINIDESIETHEDFWSAVRNKYGSYDVRVDLGPENTESTSYRYKGEASHIGHVPVGKISDVPPNIEPILPPHARSKRSQRQFQTVHLNFNLSQSATYQTTTAVDDLRGAELYLSREKLYDCIFHECSDKRPVPFFNNKSGYDEIQENNSHLDQTKSFMPFYQRVYILRIYGYDSFGEPRSQIFESKLIKVDQTTPIVFNVYPIVKEWMMNPESNHGIIVRVTNEHQGHTNLQGSYGIPEHVRLKRQFRSKSENDKDWEHNQPYILVYSKSPESSKKHVKRHHEETDSMQADDPDKSTSSPINRRDYVPSQSRRGSSSRNPSGSRNGQQRPRGKVKQGDRCSKRTLSINFDEVGWSNWIIAPQAYFANYCAGDCSWPLADTQNATNHAIIQSIYNLGGQQVPKSCCAPVKLAKMAILYQLDGIVQMRQYDDMIVEACGCL